MTLQKLKETFFLQLCRDRSTHRYEIYRSTVSCWRCIVAQRTKIWPISSVIDSLWFYRNFVKSKKCYPFCSNEVHVGVRTKSLAIFWRCYFACRAWPGLWSDSEHTVSLACIDNVKLQAKFGEHQTNGSEVKEVSLILNMASLRSWFP